MDPNYGLKRPLLLWWKHNWDLLVANLAMPVALVLLIILVYWLAGGHSGPAS